MLDIEDLRFQVSGVSARPETLPTDTGGHEDLPFTLRVFSYRTIKFKRACFAMPAAQTKSDSKPQKFDI